GPEAGRPESDDQPDESQHGHQADPGRAGDPVAVTAPSDQLPDAFPCLVEPHLSSCDQWIIEPGQNLISGHDPGTSGLTLKMRCDFRVVPDAPAPLAALPSPRRSGLSAMHVWIDLASSTVVAVVARWAVAAGREA